MNFRYIIVSILMFLIFYGCKSDKKIEFSKRFPPSIEGINITAYSSEKDGENLKTLLSFNQNREMIQYEKGSYKDNYIEIFHYPTDEIAFSEYSLTRDPTYNYSNEGLKYEISDNIIFLYKDNIYKIHGEKSKSINKLLNLTPKSSIKIKNSKKNHIINSEKLILQTDQEFPFIDKMVQKSYIFNSARVSTYEPYGDKKISVEKMENFISKQTIVEKNGDKTIFKMDQDDTYYLWLPKKGVIVFDFEIDEKIWEF